jgi:LysM repeat protein
MRKLCFFLLLIAGWAIIFWPIYSDDLVRLGVFSSNAHPSTSAYPPAWQNTERVLVRNADEEVSGGFPVTASAGAVNCGGTYILQHGDTLGDVARGCGVTLADLLSANPHITNPNHVFPGQQIVVPDPQAGRGGADPAAGADIADEGSFITGWPGTFRPGSDIKIEAGGLPPNTPVRIGLGLSTPGYSVIAQAQTGADGRLSMILTLPADALPGDSAFIMITTQGTPSVQRMSELFAIRE